MLSKRIFDVIFAILALTAMFPIMIIIAALIRLSSPGNIFFKQTRIGQFGKKFQILKFRTMVQNSSGLKISTSNDARITFIGKFLRKWKLDELPQFINVLKGDMSVVGPRPEVEEYVAYYTPYEKKKILSVKPGITDWAAIQFRNENEILSQSLDPQKTYIMEILPKKISYYLDYVSEQSLKNDFIILWQTFYTVVFK